MKKTLLFVSNNEHKINEVKKIIASLNQDIGVLAPKDLNLPIIDAVEDGESYHENALIKANAYAQLYDGLIIADDSGIEIEGLGKHFPGIHTRRYAELLGGQNSVNQFLTEKAKRKTMKATFYCVICLLRKGRKPRFFKGEMDGAISDAPSGNHGFGYDPIFQEKTTRKIVATLDETIKNQLSHRAHALKKLVKYLAKHQ